MKKPFTSIAFIACLMANLISGKAEAQCPVEPETYPFSFGGNNYEIVKAEQTWVEAAACAALRSGHLVYINSDVEQAAVYNAILASGIPVNYKPVLDGGGISYIWTGATDLIAEGTWMWGVGDAIAGTSFWTGQGSAGTGGGTNNGQYVNWGGTSTGAVKEPDDYLSNQDAAAIALSAWPNANPFLGVAGEWNDISITNSIYYIIEFENQTGLKNTDSKDKVLLSPNPVKDKLFINAEAKIKGYRIFTMGGATLSGFSGKLDNSGLDISSLNSGSYFILLEEEGNKYHSVKFIKE